MPPKRQGETPPKRQIKSKQLTNVVPAATAVNLKWKWKHQCKVDGHRRADNYFQEDWWSRRCFLQAVHFLQTLSEGCGDRLTKPNMTVRRWHCLRKAGGKVLLRCWKVKRMHQKHIQKLIDICGRANPSKNVSYNQFSLSWGSSKIPQPLSGGRHSRLSICQTQPK